jgi:glycosyltransferase involved in cell wall biosynthesis
MLPPSWELQAIDGVTEQEVYDILSESKIFLSFSEFEGLAMPPVMAALSGNMVVGYTGEGNKEYFNLTCFQEIPCGDIKAFADKVIEVIKLMSTGSFEIDEAAIRVLSNMFSKEKQQQFLMQLIDAVDAGA